MNGDMVLSNLMIRLGGTVWLVLLLLCSHVVSGQAERGFTRDGNRQFDKQKYEDAEVAYKKALEKKNNFPEAVFNLGDAYYKQKRYDEAAKQFDLSAKLLADPKRKAQSWHNLGNCKLEKEQWQDAVSAYKQALKLNPADHDTKYNLAYANEKLREQNQKQQNQKNDKKQDQKQEKQDQKDQQKKQDQKDGQNKENKDQQQNGNEKKDEPRPQKGGLSKEQAEKLLEALKREEQKAQEKMDKKTAKPAEIKVEKDW